MKKIIFILFFFLNINLFLFSQDYEKEYDRIQNIQNSIFQIRDIFILFAMPNHFLDELPLDIEENINKLIYDLSTPSYISFENNIYSRMYELLFNMLIDELEYMKLIIKNIHNYEYWTLPIFHTLDNAIELGTMIIVMIALKEQT
jgi:hypothetical protein